MDVGFGLNDDNVGLGTPGVAGFVADAFTTKIEWCRLEIIFNPKYHPSSGGSNEIASPHIEVIGHAANGDPVAVVAQMLAFTWIYSDFVCLTGWVRQFVNRVDAEGLARYDHTDCVVVVAGDVSVKVVEIFIFEVFPDDSPATTAIVMNLGVKTVGRVPGFPLTQAGAWLNREGK